MLLSLGLSYKTCPVSVRERLAFGKQDIPGVLKRLHALEGVREAMVLATCNRVEIYVVTGGASATELRGDANAAALAERRVRELLEELGGEEISDHLVRRADREAAEHLYRVSGSLDSAVVGEPQILGQLKEAFEVAQQTNTLGLCLLRAMQGSLHAGKRIRTETAIGIGQLSIPRLAVEMARDKLGELRGLVGALIGAGEMAELSADLLHQEGTGLRIVNRDVAKARRLAERFGAIAHSLDDIGAAITDVDLVISSTARPTYVLTRSLMEGIVSDRRGRPLLLIDLAVPRDVEPEVATLPGVWVLDVDLLVKRAEDTRQKRAAELARAEAIVREEVDQLEGWLLGRTVAPTIVELRGRVQSTLEHEVRRTLAQRLKHLPEHDRDALLTLVHAATNKLLHAPAVRLKALASSTQARAYIEMLQHLFDITPKGTTAGGDGAAWEGLT